MKGTCILLVASTVFLNCYSSELLEADEKVPDDVQATFYLQNGCAVESDASQHSRGDGGYRVGGTLLAPTGDAQIFEGFVPDENITDIRVIGFDWLATTIAVVTCGCLCAAVVVGFSGLPIGTLR